jgi:hypothetical protein
MHWRDSETVFNDSGDNRDFRVESDSNANAIFMNAGNGTTAFGTTTDNYNHASNEGIYLSPGSSSSFTANSPPIRVNRNGTGGNDRSNIELYNNGNIRGWIGSLGAEDGIFLYANGSRGMHLYSDEMVVNQDSHDYDFRVETNNATHMFYVDSTNGRIGINTNTPAHMLNLAGTGDVGIHIQADTDNSGENDNPYLSMGQDGSSSQQLKIGMVGEAGQEFNDSVANAAFIHANNATNQPLQIAHYGDAVVDFYRTGPVFNQAGRDQDLRVESVADSHMLFVDAATNAVGFGDSSPFDTSWGTAASTRQVSIEGTNYAVLHLKGTNSPTTRWAIGAGLGKMYGAYDDTNAIHHVTYNAGSATVFNDESKAIDFRVESDNRTSALFVDGGTDTVHIAGQGVGTTSLYVHGGISKGSASHDPELSGNISNGSHYGIQHGGSIEAVYGFSGTGRSGSQFVLEYAAGTWKSYSWEITISTTRGMARIYAGGYNNSSDQRTIYTYDNSNIITSVVGARTSTTAAGQGNKLTITMNGSDVHPMMTVKYSQAGGDSTPRAERLFVSTVY